MLPTTVEGHAARLAWIDPHLEEVSSGLARGLGGIVATTLAAWLLICLPGAGTALAESPGAMSAAGTVICKTLGPSAHRNACRRVQADLKRSTPMVYQLSQVIEGTTDAARGPKVTKSEKANYAAATLSQLRRYAYEFRQHNFSRGVAPTASPAYGSNPTRFYDDNAWAGVALVTLYHQTGKKRYLNAAEQEWRFERGGQRKAADGSDAGIWWNTKKPYISSGSTGGAVRLALELYQIDRDAGKLAFAEKNYGWARRHLRNAKSNLYGNTPNQHTATPAHQGWFIDDGRLLHAILDRIRPSTAAAYLAQATATATAAAARFDQSSYCTFNPSEFAGMFASFVRLASGNTPYANALHNSLHEYVTWAANHTNNGDFIAPPGCAGDEVLQQAGVSWTFTMHGLGLA